jgi:hypothetical protein
MFLKIVLKFVFLIAIVAVVMIGVAVPSGFADCTLSLPFERLE